MKLSGLVMMTMLGCCICSCNKAATNASNTSAPMVPYTDNFTAPAPRDAFPMAASNTSSPGPSGLNDSRPPPEVPDARGFIYCETLAARVSPGDCSYYQEMFSRLETGTAALNAPASMTLGVAQEVSFAIARPASAERPGQPTAVQALGNTPTAPPEDIRVARRMAARLEGDGFTITPDAVVDQDLSLGTARWTWTVTPTSEGRHRLVLTAYVVLQPPGGGIDRAILATTPKDIDVTVRPVDRARGLLRGALEWLSDLKNLLIALTALIVAAVGLRAAWKKWWKRK